MHCFKATEKHSAISSPGAFLQQAWGDGPYCPHGLSAGGANQGFWQEETIMTCIPQLKRKCIGDAVLIGPVDRTPWAYVCKYKTNRFVFFFVAILIRKQSVWNVADDSDTQCEVKSLISCQENASSHTHTVWWRQGRICIWLRMRSKARSPHSELLFPVDNYGSSNASETDHFKGAVCNILTCF